jgi:glutamate-ammonia-ligase adenylyltransferase
VLRIAERDIVAAHGRIAADEGGDSGLVVVAYGSFGGCELGFGSDLDLVFLYDGTRAQRESDGAKPLDGMRYYARFAQRIVHLLGTQTRAGRLYEVDVRLRPDGSKGMLVQSLDGYEGYQRERAWTWELQALVRARAVAGDATLARRFATVRADLLAQPRDADALRIDVTGMRTRWRAERDRSSAEQFDLKQGAGGLVDIEFLLQGMVLQHAMRYPDLLVDGGSAALIDALHDCGLIDIATAAAFAAAHADLLARAIRCTLDARPRVAARDADIERVTVAVREAARRCGFDFADAASL